MKRTIWSFVSDPRIRDTASSAIKKLIHGAQEIQSNVQQNVARFVSANFAAGHEIYFLIDISSSVKTNPDLNATLTFAVNLVKRVSNFCIFLLIIDVAKAIHSLLRPIC